jgi:hypothetical protein
MAKRRFIVWGGGWDGHQPKEVAAILRFAHCMRFGEFPGTLDGLGCREKAKAW